MPTYLGAQNQLTAYSYDAQGNLLTYSDPLKHITTWTYDALNRPNQLTDPAKSVVNYSYNGMDTLIGVTDQRSLTTSYTRDGLQNLLQQQSPDTGVTNNTYDEAGNLISSADAKSQKTVFHYDALNRLTLIKYADNRQHLYQYDEPPNGIGRLTSIEERDAQNQLLASIRYRYDALGRLITEFRTIAGIVYETRYSYDSNGRLTGMTYPSGRAVTYSLDALSRPQEIETRLAGVSQKIVQNITWQPFGPAEKMLYGNTEIAGHTFDLDGRIDSYTSGSESRSLTYDAASRITEITNPAVTPGSLKFGYDNLSRLTSAINSSTSSNYAYDAVGNRVTKNAGDLIETYSYQAKANQIATISARGNSRTYSHDANGAITSDGINSYSYDARGRLIQTTSVSGVTRYEINALGQRIRKIGAALDVVYHYDKDGKIIAETTALGRLLREYVWVEGRPVVVLDQPTIPSNGCVTIPGIDLSGTFSSGERLVNYEILTGGRRGGVSQVWQFGGEQENMREPVRAAYDFTLTQDRSKAMTLTVKGGQTVLFTKSWRTSEAGNALKFKIASSIRTAVGAPPISTTTAKLNILSINGRAVNSVLETPQGNATSENAVVFSGETLTEGFTVEGRIDLLFDRTLPPYGLKLEAAIASGRVTCVSNAPQAGTAYYIHADHLGTPRLITNQQKQLVWRWDNIEPFGATAANTSPIGLPPYTFNLRFPGQYFDQESGLHQNTNRDYEPATGRYMQSDPIGLAGRDSNLYRYVSGNPVSYIDPLGLRWVDVYIWHPGQGPSRVGHVMVTEADSKTVLTSQYPHPPGGASMPFGYNHKLSYDETFAEQGNIPPAAKHTVWVNDDIKADAAASDHQLRKWWSAQPYRRVTNATHCGRAAFDVIKEGGFFKGSTTDNSWWMESGQMLPMTLDDLIREQCKTNRTLCR